MENKTPHVFRSFFLSILHAVIFLVVYILIILLIVLILTIASYIPIIRGIAGMLLTFIENRGDGVVICSMYFSLTAAYYSSKHLLLRITKHDPTRWLSLKLSGIWLAGYSICILIGNFANGEYEAWIVCVTIFICAIIVYFSSKEYAEKPTQPKSEEYYMLEAANGMIVRVPASKLDEWQAEQERLRNQGSTRELTEAEEQFKDEIIRRIYNTDSTEGN